MDGQLARQASIRMVLGIAAVKDWELRDALASLLIGRGCGIIRLGEPGSGKKRNNESGSPESFINV